MSVHDSFMFLSQVNSGGYHCGRISLVECNDKKIPLFLPLPFSKRRYLCSSFFFFFLLMK